MLKINLFLLGFLFIFLISPHTTSGFQPEGTIEWSLAKAACAQLKDYENTETIQSRLISHKFQNSSEPEGYGIENCGNLKRTYCDSTECQRFKCTRARRKRQAQATKPTKPTPSPSASNTTSNYTSSTRVILVPARTRPPRGNGTTPLPQLPNGTQYVGPVKQQIIDGFYTWDLLFDVNNTQNGGSIFRRSSYTIQTNAAYTTLIAGSVIKNLKNNFHAGFGFKVEMIEFKPVAYYDITLHMHTDSAFTKRSDTCEEFNAEVQFQVGPYSRLLLYQLKFQAPGYTRTYMSLSSHVHHKPVRQLRSVFYYKTFLKGIDVNVVAEAMDMPDTAVLGYDPNVSPGPNLGFTGDTTFLTPVWSDLPKDRIYAVQVAIQTEISPNHTSMSSGGTGPNRYLTVKRDYNDGKAINKIFLFRTTDPNESPATFGFTDCTNNINAGRGHSWLHLCWFTQIVSAGPVPDE